MVGDELLEALSAVGAHGGVGVQVEALEAGAARAAQLELGRDGEPGAMEPVAVA